MRNFFKLFLSSFCFAILIFLISTPTQVIASSCDTCGSVDICTKEKCETLGECAFQGELDRGVCLYKTSTTTYSGRSFVNVNFSVPIIDMLTGGSSLQGKVVNFNIVDQYNNQVYKSPSCTISNNKCSFSVSMPSGPSFKVALNKQGDSAVFDCAACSLTFSVFANNTTRELQLVRNKRIVSFFAGFCPNPLETTCSTALTSPVTGALIKLLDRATTVADCLTNSSGVCRFALKEGGYSFNPPTASGFSYYYSSLSPPNTPTTNFSLPGITDISFFFKKNLYSGLVSCKGYQAGDKIEIFRGPVKIADFPVSTVYSHSIKLENDILYTAVVSGSGLSSMKQDFSIQQIISTGLTFSQLNFLCSPKKTLTTIIPEEKRTNARIQGAMVMVRLQGTSFNDYSCLSDGTDKTCNLNLPVGNYEAYIANDPFYQCWSEEGCPIKFSVKTGDGPTVFLPLIRADLSLFKKNYCREVGEAGNIFQQSAVKFFDYQTGKTLACMDACVGTDRIQECSCGVSMYQKTLKDCENGCVGGACIRSCETSFGAGYVCSPSPTFVEGYKVWPETFKNVCPGIEKPFKSYSLTAGEICNNKGNSTCVICEEPKAPQSCLVAQDCTELQCITGQEKGCVQGSCSCVTSTPVAVVEGKDPPCLFFGDARADGKINEVDISQANSCVGNNCNASKWLRSEVTGDGVVTGEDVNLIKQYSEGKVATFPVCSMPEFLKGVALINPGGRLSYMSSVQVELGSYYYIAWYSWGIDKVDLSLAVYDAQEKYLGSQSIAQGVLAGDSNSNDIQQGGFYWKVKKPTGIVWEGVDLTSLKYKVVIKDSVGASQGQTQGFLKIPVRTSSLSEHCSQCGSAFSCKEERCLSFGNCVFSSFMGIFGSCSPQESCSCQSYSYPVCGADGKTYLNDCYAKCAGVNISYEDTCVAKIKANIEAGIGFSKIKITEISSSQAIASLTTDSAGKALIELFSKIPGRMFEFAKYKIEVLEQEKYNCDYMSGIATNCEIYFEASQKMLDRNDQWWLYLQFAEKDSPIVLKNCGDCGQGILNICDKEECESNSKCLFEPGVIGIGGACRECDCDTTPNPVCGDNGQTYTNGCLAKCSGINNYSAGACQQTGKVSFTVIEVGSAVKIKDAKVIVAKSLGGLALVSCLTDNNGACSVDLPQGQITYYAFVEKDNYECLTVSSCFRSFVFSPSESSLYYILSAKKISEKLACSDCGKNSFGYCKESECLGLGDCKFTKGFIGGTCQENTACLCTQEYNPVCGTDGKTYSNACYAKCAQVSVAYDGVCKSGCVCIAQYLPVCGTDGKTYSNACYAKCAQVEVAYTGECKLCKSSADCACIPEAGNPVCGKDGKCACEKPPASCKSSADCVCIPEAGNPVCGKDGKCVCEDARVEKAMKVVLPNGGEEWKAGETRQIKWNSQGEINRVEIRIYNFSYSLSGMYKIILREAPSQVGDNSYNWTIPAGFFTQNLKWKSGDSLKIEVIEYTSNGEYGVSDQSDSFVKIISSEPPVVIEPIIKEFQIKLYEGWNYISSPTKENLFFSTIKQFCETSDKYQGFIKYLGETPKPELYSKVTPYEGSLVGVEADCIVFVKGDKFVFEINKIPAGWNLVSFPGSVSDFKGDCVIEKIKGTDVNNQPKDFNLNDNLLKEKGYWIKVANDCSLYPVR